MDTNTLEATALQQARNVITAMEQAIIQFSASSLDTQNSYYRTISRSYHRSTSHSPNTCRSPHSTRKYRKSPISRFHQITHITSNTYSSQEDKPPTDVASDGHTLFHTTVPVITEQGNKPMPVKDDTGVDVNTIPLSKYGNSSQHTWTTHDNTPQQFLGFFIANIHHKTGAEILPVRF